MLKVQSTIEASEGKGKVLVRNVQGNCDEVVLEVVDLDTNQTCILQVYGHELIVAVENAMNYYKENRG